MKQEQFLKTVRHVSKHIITITSESNKTFKELRSLLGARGIKKTGRTLVAGKKIIHELLLMKPNLILGWISPGDVSDMPPGLPADVPHYRLSNDLFSKLDVNGTSYPLVIASTPEIPPFDEMMETADAILAIPFQDPANVGAVIRSAVAFGVRTVILLKECANPFHQKCIRAAGPSLFLADMRSGPSIRDLACERYDLVILDAAGCDVESYAFPRRFILLPGLEGTGVPSSLKSGNRIGIAMDRSVESLNAAIATSIALYHSRRNARR